jgi:hypothetical protein
MFFKLSRKIFTNKNTKIISFLFFFVSLLVLLKVLLLGGYPDFSQYFYGLKTIIHGLNPYIADQNSLTPTVYPPFVLLLLFPFSFLPIFLAGKIWTIFSIIFLFSGVYLIFRIYNKKIFSSVGFVILGLVCLSFPVKFTLGMGQINNLILFLFVLSIYFLEKKKKYFSSLFLALSLAIKLFPIFFPLYFLLKRKWTLLFFTFTTIGLFYLASFLIDPKINIYFYKNILPTFLSGWKTDYYNQSLTGFIGRSITEDFIRSSIRYFLSALFIFVSFLVIYKSHINQKLANMHLGLLVSLNLIVSNFSWQHHFVFMIFPFIITLFYIQKIKKNLKFLLWLFIAYILISFNLKDPNAVPILLQSHVFYGAVLLWILQVFLIWKGSRKLQPRFPLTLKH